MFSQEGWRSGKEDECKSSARVPGVNKHAPALDLRKLELLKRNVIYLTECKCLSVWWPRARKRPAVCEYSVSSDYK